MLDAIVICSRFANPDVQMSTVKPDAKNIYKTSLCTVGI